MRIFSYSRKTAREAVSSVAVPLMVFLFVTGCSGNADYPIHSRVEGELSVRVDIDSTADYTGFRISVVTQKDGDVDTLGTAITAADGQFLMDVFAPEEGVYPIVVERNGAALTMGEFVAVHDDSVSISGTFPLGPRSLRIVSPENAAWTAYKNAKAQHNRSMVEVIESEGYTPEDLGRVAGQTSTILWSIKNTYEGTIGADIAMAESVVMMEGWNDPLVLERLAEVDYDNESIVEVARAARRSKTRMDGQDAAFEMLKEFEMNVSEDKVPGIKAEMVIAYSDGGLVDEAVAIATDLRREYPDSPWAEWASRATYDLENLQPGMNAPGYSVASRTGEAISSSTLDGKFVVLEFFDPAEQIWQRDLEIRDGIARALSDVMFQTVAVSVEPDIDINEALFDGADHPGHFVFSEEGLEQQIVKDFNVNVLPTRFLIDPDGILVAKYTGPALMNLERDLASIVESLNRLAEQMNE